MNTTLVFLKSIARIVLNIKLKSIIDASSIINISNGSLLFSLKFVFVLPGRTPNRECRVLALAFLIPSNKLFASRLFSLQIFSKVSFNLSRLAKNDLRILSAALPVGAANARDTLLPDNKVIIDTSFATELVLPVPGPPVITDNLQHKDIATETFCQCTSVLSSCSLKKAFKYF